MAARKGGRRSVRRTPAEIERDATITNGDVARARKRWRDVAPPGLRDLLDAVPLEPKRGRRRASSDPTS